AEHRVGRGGEARLGVAGPDAEVLDDARGYAGCAVARRHPRRGAALRDRRAEESASARSAEESCDAGRTGRLAEHGDAVGVAAECGGAGASPFEAGDLIEDAGVS